MSKKYEPIITLEEIYQAKIRLKDVAQKTPLSYSERLSSIYGANIYLKREDLQVVRSYKIRGAYKHLSS
jgi:L-threonine ammonia-lyase (EC 4.3.1.19)